MREPSSSHSPILRRATPLVAAVAGIVSLGALSVPTARADNQDVIDYREHIMKTMAAQVQSIQLIVQKKVPAGDAANFATNVKILAMTAATAKAAFAMNVAGGQAKPNVWANGQLAADFAKRMDELVANTADLAKAAESGGVAATAPKLQSALTCKGCHDQYREQKKQ